VVSGAAGLQFYTTVDFQVSLRPPFAIVRDDATLEAKKAQKAKHTSDPIFLAPGTLLSTALRTGVRTL
jgi:hypothetical protein